jgi:hypothetical protein
MPTLSHTTMQWPVRLLPYTLFLLLYVLGCRGQTPEVPPPPPPLPPVTYPEGIYRPEDLGINYHFNTYLIFWDGEKAIDSISSNDIALKNPYRNINLKPFDDGEIGIDKGWWRMYDLSSLSLSQKEDGLNNILPGKIPIDSLKRSNMCNSGVRITEYNLNTVIVAYSFVLYKGSSLEFGAENWSETTLHIYNKKGVLKKVMVINENLTLARPTEDGQYLLSESEAARFGDAESGIVDGVWLYDLHKGKTIGKIPMESKFFRIASTQFGYDIQVDNGTFLIYVGLQNELYTTPSYYEKIIVDPSKRMVYKKKMDNDAYYNLVKERKTYLSFKIKEEDLSTYTSVRL